MLVMDSIPASKKDDAKKLADGILMESSLQSMVAPLFAYLPEKAVKIGDTWESSYLNSANKITFVMLNTYTLKDLDKKLGTISGTSEIETMPSNDPNAQISMDMKGTTQIDGNIDISTGLSLKTTAKNIIEGTMVTKNNGTETKIPMKIEGSTETIMIK